MSRHKLWIFLDSIKRKTFLKNQLKILILKSIKKSRTTNNIKRYYASYQLTTISGYSNSSKISNRCVVSGRVWSVSKKTDYNRFVLRSEISKSNIPGFSRASW